MTIVTGNKVVRVSVYHKPTRTTESFWVDTCLDAKFMSELIQGSIRNDAAWRDQEPQSRTETKRRGRPRKSVVAQTNGATKELVPA